MALACTNPLCPCTDNPLANLSSERPDRRIFIGFGYSGFTSLGCYQICHSEESQEAADLCARRLAETCHPGTCPDGTQPPCDGVEPGPVPVTGDPIYFNNAQECLRDGFPHSIPSGVVAGWSQPDADARALSLCRGFSPAPVPPPSILCPSIVSTSPSSPLTVNPGDNVTLSAEVSYFGAGPLSYLWLKDDLPLMYTPGPSLTLNNVQPTDAGQYDLQVSAPGCEPVLVNVLTLGLVSDCAPDIIDSPIPFTLYIVNWDEDAAGIVADNPECIPDAESGYPVWDGYIGKHDMFGANESTPTSYYAISDFLPSIVPPFDNAASIGGKKLNYAEVWGPVLGSEFLSYFELCEGFDQLSAINPDTRYWFLTIGTFYNHPPTCPFEPLLCGAAWIGSKCGDGPDGEYSKVFCRSAGGADTLTLAFDEGDGAAPDFDSVNLVYDYTSLSSLGSFEANHTGNTNGTSIGQNVTVVGNYPAAYYRLVYQGGGMKVTDNLANVFYTADGFGASFEVGGIPNVVKFDYPADVYTFANCNLAEDDIGGPGTFLTGLFKTTDISGGTIKVWGNQYQTTAGWSAEPCNGKYPTMEIIQGILADMPASIRIANFDDFKAALSVCAECEDRAGVEWDGSFGLSLYVPDNLIYDIPAPFDDSTISLNGKRISRSSCSIILSELNDGTPIWLLLIKCKQAGQPDGGVSGSLVWQGYKTTGSTPEGRYLHSDTYAPWVGQACSSSPLSLDIEIA